MIKFTRLLRMLLFFPALYCISTATAQKGNNPVNPYDVKLTVASPPNDDCVNASPLTVGSTCVGTAGDLNGANESIPPLSCNGFTSVTAFDVWYSFIAG